MKINTIISALQWKPFDTSTSEGRSKERYRRVFLTALSSVLSRGIGILTGLISVPLTLNYLGAERYGLWLTITSIITMLSFADLGIGNGLINAISEANGKNDKDMAKQYVSSAFFILTTIALFIGFVFAVSYSWIPWKNMFNISSSTAIAESGPAMAVFVCCFLFNMPLGIVQRIQMGYQEGFINNLWQGIGSLLGLASLLLVIYLKVGLPLLVLAMAGLPAIITGLNGIFLFGYRRTWLRPEWRSVNIPKIRYILKNGMLFFTLQIAGTIGFQTDNIVISYFLGADQVPQYAVPMKLFWLVPTLYGFILMPLWSAYGEALTRNDFVWIRKTFIKFTGLSFIMAFILSIILVIFGVQIIRLWVGSSVTPSYFLLLGFGMWAVITSLNGSIAMFLNGINVIGFQIFCSLLMSILNLIISITLVQKIGVAGAIYGTVIAITLFNLLPSAFFIRRMFLSWEHVSYSV